MPIEDLSRILYAPYKTRIRSAEEAARLIRDQDVVGVSGFTKAGDSKSVLPAFATRAEHEDVRITLMSGASLGYDTDGRLARHHALIKRLPFQVDPVLRDSINRHETLYIDQHLGETAELLANGHLPHANVAIIEATYVDANGFIVPTTSVGNSAIFAAQADTIIIEINTSIPLDFLGIHDVYIPPAYPHREPYLITRPDSRIGTEYIRVDPGKVAAIVFTDKPDSPARISAPDDKTSAISALLLDFFKNEVHAGRMGRNLMPLQAGIGKIANAVLSGFKHSDFENLTMYSEVLQDSTFELFDAGKMTFASASSITVSEDYHRHFLSNFIAYKDKIVLRPQNVSNAAEVIRRLGVIAINTAIEFDIYGNINSTHIMGTRIMNGIGGSGDFARNAYLSIFVCPSVSKENAISHVVPMVSHIDHTGHDVDILVTENGLADLRGLAPIERAQVIIDNCVHPDYCAQLQAYFDQACARGGQTPHLMDQAFAWHLNYQRNKTMKL